MQRFFDVLLADSSADVTVKTWRFTSSRSIVPKPAWNCKQFSELDVAALDAEYQVVRQQGTASVASQRLTRSLLAQAINNPQKLPNELQPLEISALVTEMPPLDELVKTSLKGNKHGWMSV